MKKKIEQASLLGVKMIANEMHQRLSVRLHKCKLTRPNQEGGQNVGHQGSTPAKPCRENGLSHTLVLGILACPARICGIAVAGLYAKYSRPSPGTFLYFVPPIEKQSDFLSTIPSPRRLACLPL